MSTHDRKLQQLRKRFLLWLPWLTQSMQANVRVVKAQVGEAFHVTVTWKNKDGSEGLHTKRYDHTTLGMRIGCMKDYARILIKETLTKRGVL